MASQDLPRHQKSPTHYANRRAFDPVLLLLALVVLTIMLALGKVSWAERAYDNEIARYQQHDR